ncbi:MAG: hypothetical protein CL912_22825 [Deltaproteobacteria bacterium]|nr:hypothetical protein [Deltaproteobacteria bacterium]
MPDKQPFLQAALHSSTKQSTTQLFLLPHLFQRAAISAITLLHPLNEQPFCCDTTSNKGATFAVKLVHPSTKRSGDDGCRRMGAPSTGL